MKKMDRLAWMARIPRLSSSDKLDTRPRVCSLGSISGCARNTILTRSEITTRRTRLTRAISLDIPGRLLRG